ncbi:hypothetical protein KZI27_14175 [Curtobacterium sp. TC1]|uniref:hypothetical protein n=1 Tax=Curtobacterium sp. TC1 TaxID=2862880 RepID=UPI001C9AE6C7|nr:hypothetical protein [Curtobacterium sp. TC1]QZQ54449.1 hypothetical protein KZI27_14175 [Curtobacterium sp. TC1]
MTNTANTTKNTPTADAAEVALPERSEITRTLNILKLSISDLYADARRRTPYFATGKAEATAKLNSALKVLTEFSNQLDSIKKS